LYTNTDELINYLTLDDLVQLYRDVLTDLLDLHCPTVKVRRRVKQSTPWFDADSRRTTPSESNRKAISPDAV